MSNWKNGEPFDCVWTPSNVEFKNDTLKLNFGWNEENYTCAEYRTKKYFKYGSYQVSLKAVSNPGICTSFFTFCDIEDKKWVKLILNSLVKIPL